MLWAFMSNGMTHFPINPQGGGVEHQPVELKTNHLNQPLDVLLRFLGVQRQYFVGIVINH